MPSTNQNSFSFLDLSGGQQTATSHLLRKRNEVSDSKNAAYNIRLGSAARRFGYEQLGQTIQFGNESLYGGIYNYGANNKILAGINNAGGTNATLNYLDTGGYWTPIITNSAPNTRFQCLNYLDELYVAGIGNGKYMTLTNIDSTLVPSTTRNVINAPQSKFIAQYSGNLYAMNCVVNGVTYRDRMYVSSPALGVVTQVQNAVSGWVTQIHVDSVRYLKVGMSIDIYGAQTVNLLYSGLVITSVDKLNNRIGFSGQTINVSANDEVWISGRFGLLTTLWNTDYPTAQTSDWIRIPPGLDEQAEFTGWTVNNNRLFIYSKNSLLKWDGSNLVLLSQSVGCVSHETICNIGSWTLWLHSTGVWGYNDTTGQLKMISKAITPTIQRINPSNLSKASAVVANRTYKLAVGQLMDPVIQTTSTSTSSTSTSSTSTSTSSTSTSSTSTSSTVSTTTSTSSTSSSISSTSSSTSSTSTSSTSTSISTSSTSTSSTSTSMSTSTSLTSTTTLPTNKTIGRLCYDFDLNIWWYEEHNREIRFQFMHSMNGYTKPYFTDENGFMFRDETGLTDAGRSIPMMVEFGRMNCGSEQNKIFAALQIDSERTRTGIIQYQLDGGVWETLGQVKDDIETFNFPQRGRINTGHDINLRFVHNNAGDPPIMNGGTIYFNTYESIVNELGVSR